MAEYPVPGHPGLFTTRPQGTATQLDQGRIDVQDLAPTLLDALDRFATWAGRHLDIFSGYRTSAYSAAHGGFAGDPHTQGIAADVDVAGSPIGVYPGAVSELQSLGLVSGNQPGFYHGQPDPAHVQLPSGTTTSGAGDTSTISTLYAGAL